MDRNTIVGLLLIVGIVFTFSVFFTPKPDPTKVPVTIENHADSLMSDQVDTIIKVQDSLKVAVVNASGDTTLTDSAIAAKAQNKQIDKFGDFYLASEGTLDTIHIVTDKLDLQIPLKGAFLTNLQLMDYLTYDQKYISKDSSQHQPIISNDPYNFMSMVFNHRKASPGFVMSKDLFFKSDAGSKEVRLKGDETKTITFSAQFGDGRKLKYIYSFSGNSYQIAYEVRMENMQDMIERGQYDIQWQATVPKTEKAMALMREKTSIYYRMDGDVDNLNPRSTETITPDPLSGLMDWLSFKSQFFTQTLLVDDNIAFQNVKLKQQTPPPSNPDDPDSGDIVRLFEAQIPINYAGNPIESRKFRFYTGPLDYYELKGFDKSMQRQIELGWGPLKWINEYFIVPIFKALEGWIGNYAIIIFILALLIKLITYPFTYKTFISTAKMRVLNQTPEMKALDEKYKGEATKLQQEKMAIYRQFGVNPLGGCLPMLLSYPFLISLFFLFPNSIELRQQSFLWAEDLSTYDSILELGFRIPMYGDHVSLFTLLMTASIFGFTIITQKAQGSMTANPTMKYLPYFMPILFLGFLNNYSAGLSYYYLISNILSIAQTVGTKFFLNDESILQKMHDKKKKKAKSGKKGRVEKWMSNQQKKAKEIRQAQQKK